MVMNVVCRWIALDATGFAELIDTNGLRSLKTLVRQVLTMRRNYLATREERGLP